MDNKFTTLHKTTEEKNNNKFNEIDNFLKALDKKIDDERDDRLKQSDENLRQIRQQLNRKFIIQFIPFNHHKLLNLK
jgi:hypothetical protein